MNYNASIAIVLALVVVAVFFVVPGLSPFRKASTGAPAGLSAAPAPTTTASGLSITDAVVGTGAAAAAGDSVIVNYVGTLADGTVFDASANHGTAGFTFTLGAGKVIRGWDEGVVGMQVGGVRTLVIPPGLAYGAAGIPGVIPANATLTFKIQLLAVTPAAR